MDNDWTGLVRHLQTGIIGQEVGVSHYVMTCDLLPICSSTD